MNGARGALEADASAACLLRGMSMLWVQGTCWLPAETKRAGETPASGALLADAKRAENQIQNVVGCSFAGD